MPNQSNPRYDEIPYESHPHELSHPHWLASVAAVFGMQPPPPRTARILELGCASGGNLIPLAETLPESHCVGVDLSRRQIEDGQRLLESAGLVNVELRQASILELNESLGQFDYIICHGVYSWVDAKTQQRILELCGSLLTPNGIAYISYNTYPGWRMLEMLRDMMLFHSKRFEDPKQQIAQARALLEVLAQAVPEADNPYGMLLKRECEQLRHRSDWYIYHEHLEENNEPLYFHEFIRRASTAGLQFLGEADLRAMLADQLAPQVQTALRAVATNIVYAEQYMDFFRNKTFRRTLLCRAGVTLSRKLKAEDVRKFHFASALRPKSEVSSVTSEASLGFEGPGWPTVAVTAPVAKATLLCLREHWPRHVAFDELEVEVRARLNLPAPTQAATLEYADMLWAWFLRRVVSMSVAPPACAARAGEFPRGSGFAKAQVQAGEKTLTNLLHGAVKLNDFDANVLALLDGSRDKTALLAQLAEPGAVPNVSVAGQGGTNPTLELRLKSALDVLAEAALLHD